MKKTTIFVVILSVAIVALSVTGFVYARFVAPTAANSTLQTGLSGRGDLGFGKMGDDMPGTGVMHDEMIKAMAEKLGVSVDDLNKKLAAGETMWSIAQAKGISEADFTTMMKDARLVAIDAAVKAGEITQAQADWMKTMPGFGGMGGDRRPMSGFSGMGGMGGGRGPMSGGRGGDFDRGGRGGRGCPGNFGGGLQQNPTPTP